MGVHELSIMPLESGNIKMLQGKVILNIAKEVKVNTHLVFIFTLEIIFGEPKFSVLFFFVSVSILIPNLTIKELSLGKK